MVHDFARHSGAPCLRRLILFASLLLVGCPDEARRDLDAAVDACTEDACLPCPPGAPGCPCVDARCGFDEAGQALVCVADRCVPPPCPPGQLGCACDSGACVDSACVEGRCTQTPCSPGATGCACVDGGCDRADDACMAERCLPAECPSGSAGCACAGDACFDEGFACVDGGCQPSGCEAGSAGCRCLAGGCAPSLRCDAGVCVANVGGEGGPCAEDGSCAAGLACNAPGVGGICLPCAPGSFGCDCDDGACAGGLVCQAERCVRPAQDDCWTPCNADLVDPITGQRRPCDADGLLEGCLSHAVCREGSCVEPGAVSGLACLEDMDCPDWQRCAAGRCRSDCRVDGDCAGGRRCIRKVCRLSCAADADCDGARCESTNGVDGVCVPRVPPSPGPAPSASGTLGVSTTTLAFTPTETEAVLTLTNNTDAEQVVLVRKLGHTVLRPDAAAPDVLLDQRNGFPRLDVATNTPGPMPCAADADCGCAAVTPGAEHPQAACRGEAGPAQICVAGRCDVPCTAGVDCPLAWLAMGLPEDVRRVQQFEVTVPAGGSADLVFQGAGDVAALRWDGAIEILHPQLNPIRLALSFRASITGRWKGQQHAFADFGTIALRDWYLSDDRDAELPRVGNALVQAWRSFRRGAIGRDEFLALLLATRTESWRLPASIAACNDGDPDGLARCYPFNINRAGLVPYTSDQTAVPIPSGVVELPIALHLRPQPTPPDAPMSPPGAISGRVDSDTTLHMVGDPAIALTFESDPAECGRLNGTSCLNLLRPPEGEPPPSITVIVGGRYEQPADAAGCADGFEAFEVPWLPGGFTRNTRAVQGGFVRTQCRQTDIPVPDDPAANAIIAAANPIPDGRARRRTVHIIDGGLIDQEILFMLYEERFEGFDDVAMGASFSTFGYMLLGRDPTPLPPGDAPFIATPTPVELPPPPPVALDVDCDAVDLAGVAELGEQVELLVEGMPRAAIRELCLADRGMLSPADDPDRDRVIGAADNCPTVYNPDGVNSDADELGDACDPDDDNDGFLDADDPCPFGAGEGSPCPADPLDPDDDGVPADLDNCPAFPNPNQADSDRDGLGDACEDDGEADAAEQPCIGTEAVHFFCEETGQFDGGGFSRDADGRILRDANGGRLRDAVPCPRGSDVIFFTVDPTEISQADIDALDCQRRQVIEDPTRPQLPSYLRDGRRREDLRYDLDGNGLSNTATGGECVTSAAFVEQAQAVDPDFEEAIGALSFADCATELLADVDGQAGAFLDFIGLGISEAVDPDQINLMIEGPSPSDGLERPEAQRGTCGDQLEAWRTAGRIVQLDPAWVCADAADAICDVERVDLRRGKLFFPADANDAPRMSPLDAAVSRAFRYKTRFRNREGTQVGFAPTRCIPDSDRVPYCYDPAQIEAVRGRVDCLLDIWRAAPALPAGLADMLTAHFGVGPVPLPVAYRGPLQEGFDLLFAELLIMLGDDAFTRALGSRYELAGVAGAPFQGSAFEAGGEDLFGVVGAEFSALYEALQYYDEVIERLYMLGPVLMKSLEDGAALLGSGLPDMAVQARNFVTPATAGLYLERVQLAASRRARTISTLADRYVAIGAPALARRVIRRGYQRAFLDSVALTRLTDDIIPVVRPAARAQIRRSIDASQQRLRASLQDMRSAFSRINDDLGQFGFPPGFLPFPTVDVRETNAFEVTFQRARQRALTAQEREEVAISQNRSFETDTAQFQAELIRIRNTFESQLSEICGSFEGSDGRIHPAVTTFAHLGDVAIQQAGDPCGLQNGALFNALVGIQDADTALRATETSFRNQLELIELRAQTVAAQCGVLADQVAFNISGGQQQVALMEQIDEAMFTISRIQNARQIAGTVLNASSSGPLGGLGSVGYVIAEAVAETFIATNEQEIAQREIALAQLQINTATYELNARCEMAQIDGELTTAELYLGLEALELEAARAEYQLRLATSEVQRLRNLAIRLQLDQAEAEQQTIAVEAARNDPNVRIFRNDAVLNAEFAFDAAIREAFRATLVFEYYTSQSFARRGDLALIRLVARGQPNLSNYLIDLEDAFIEFEEEFGLPDTRVLVLSLRDDLMGIPRMNDTGTPLSVMQRTLMLREALRDPNRLDPDGYVSFAFDTRLDQLSPVTANHKILYVEAAIEANEPEDRTARLYLDQAGTTAVAALDGETLFFRLPPRRAVLNPFFNMNRPFPLEVYQNRRLRDLPVVASDWRLVLNLRDEAANADLDLESLQDIKLYLYYTDFTP